MTYDEWKLATPPESTEPPTVLICDHCDAEIETFWPEHYKTYSKAFIKAIGKEVEFCDIICDKCKKDGARID